MNAALLAELAVIGGLVAAILAVLVVKARQTIRRERGQPRGLAPGTGDHIIDVEYSSGLGGGHASQIRVPRDPQAYARRFVPRGRTPRTSTTGPSKTDPGTTGTSEKDER